MNIDPSPNKAQTIIGSECIILGNAQKLTAILKKINKNT